MGHKGNSMDDLYDKIKEDVSSARCGRHSVVSASSCPQLYRVYGNVPKTLENQ